MSNKNKIYADCEKPDGTRMLVEITKEFEPERITVCGFKCAIHRSVAWGTCKPTREWAVTEIRTGLAMAIGGITKEAAIGWAHYKVSEHGGIAGTRKVISAFLKRRSIKNAHRVAKKIKAARRKKRAA